MNKSIRSSLTFLLGMLVGSFLIAENGFLALFTVSHLYVIVIALVVFHLTQSPHMTLFDKDKIV